MATNLNVSKPWPPFDNYFLWDGQCSNEGTCCMTKSPPWFSVELPNPIILKYVFVAMKAVTMKTLQLKNIH